MTKSIVWTRLPALLESRGTSLRKPSELANHVQRTPSNYFQELLSLAVQQGIARRMNVWITENAFLALTALNLKVAELKQILPAMIDSTAIRLAIMMAQPQRTALPLQRDRQSPATSVKG